MLILDSRALQVCFILSLIFVHQVGLILRILEPLSTLEKAVPSPRCHLILEPFHTLEKSVHPPPAKELIVGKDGRAKTFWVVGLIISMLELLYTMEKAVPVSPPPPSRFLPWKKLSLLFRRHLQICGSRTITQLTVGDKEFFVGENVGAKPL
ncbi:hypothetical protein B0H14DRAFT_2591480 [Mycena olivaceomarginata]|nr:hypothetical protein B0H14DRAFT_2591480 [Mycena olivaceomarginata]